ncbi:uncharacterized protein [Choristoneura fumiferana]|uniref:uncharacterized protein n=1 Tax=Choristoneura fumiferana TaxID=7141 RepID=UPI003D15443F
MICQPFLIEPVGPTASSSLLKSELELEDSGQYMCSSPPFSVTKFVLVQNKGIVGCARGAFSCGPRCVLAPFVCDGRSDCEHGEDEAPPVCPAAVCQRPEMLNCSSGRCIPAAACCAPLCPSQPGCCSEHAQYNRKGEGYMEVEYPALYEDRHTPDDYGFIQSTIYTVTACALIFMIAVVLLVSALCKMHMKRAALRSYARAAAARHYTAHQTPRFPPCYEASRLLEQEAGRAPPPLTPDVAMQTTPDPQTEDGNPDPNAGYGLSRLGAIFSTRYRQVPTECDVEMTTVRSRSLHASPVRNRTRLDEYRSPTFCDQNDEFFINAETGNCARELNFTHPVELYRSRLDARRLTLQLGRFQLSLPRLGRAGPEGGAPTYTRNGRTIRLLGGNFENYPRPPPYDLRKITGPPPEYLSRDALNNAQADAEATTNVEMPPRYEDVNCNDEHIERVGVALNVIRESGESLDTLGIPAIDDVNANEIVSD